MDLVAGSADLIVIMEHCDSKGWPKLRRVAVNAKSVEQIIEGVDTGRRNLGFGSARVGDGRRPDLGPASAGAPYAKRRRGHKNILPG